MLSIMKQLGDTPDCAPWNLVRREGDAHIYQRRGWFARVTPTYPVAAPPDRGLLDDLEKLGVVEVWRDAEPDA